MDQDPLDDAWLATWMAAAGIAGTPATLRDLLTGINAAPVGADAADWIRLVAPDATAAQADTLARLKKALAERPCPSDPPPAARLAALRAELMARGLDGFAVPRADEHQGEYVAGRAERLAWITGFTGSAGLAVVLLDKAAVFVDGRYTLQVSEEVDGDAFARLHLVEDPHDRWIAEHLPPGGKLGYDPWLHTVNWVEKTRKAIEPKRGELVPVDHNPIDAIWTCQPPAPIAPVVPHPAAFAGREAADKRSDLGAELSKAGDDAAVLTAPDSIAWLLNIRGGDIPHTPTPLSFAVLHASGHVDLFVDPRKPVPELNRHLGNHVTLQPTEALGAGLDALGAASATVRLDPATAPAWVFDRLHRSGATLRREMDPCTLPKARKSETELAGSRAAHTRDGIAVCRFLAWLAEEAPGGRLTESDCAQRLTALRGENDRFRDVSFDTISGAGPNGAIVHYRVSSNSNRRLETGSLYLIDSGAQYLDGTTDITRTVAVGSPTAEMRDRFTRVLKGHIALATARFPRGTTGSQLDTLARQYLWQAGLDFDHGTGHGVGNYLSVHEGPQRISKSPNAVVLEPGMILSNEPGYYKTGEYGIRIENLIVVRPCAALEGAEKQMLEFEVLTLAPIDLALVEPSLMTGAEIDWLNRYHDRVRTALGDRLDGGTADWLRQATGPIS